MQCGHCQKDFPIYLSSCPACGYTMRDRVPNIDLLKSIMNILIYPVETMTNLIYAEKKNLILFWMLIGVLKISLLILQFNIHVIGIPEISLQWLIMTSAAIGIILLFNALLVKIISVRMKNTIRFKDALTLLVFSQTPLSVAFIILTIPEFVIFGRYQYMHVPSAFMIHPALAYLFMGIEFIFIGWTLFLTWKMVRLFISSKLYIFLMSMILGSILYCAPAFFAGKLFWLTQWK